MKLHNQLSEIISHYNFLYISKTDLVFVVLIIKFTKMSRFESVGIQAFDYWLDSQMQIFVIILFLEI